MIRPLAILGTLVLVLALWDAALARRESRASVATNRVGALFTPEEAENLRKQPALRIQMRGENHAYGRVQGVWRTLSYRNAPADGRALQNLIEGLVRAEGFVHSRDVDEAAVYGINSPETIRVALQGPRAGQDPAGDVLAELDIGKTVPGREQTFLRRKGTKEIWAVDGDLRGPLERRLAPDLPPLLAPSALPAGWLEAAGGILGIDTVSAAGRFRLERHDRALDPATLAPGDLPWSWVIDPGAGEHELDVEVASAYASFLERLPYADVLEAGQRDTLGLAAPAVELTLTARPGDALRLAFGQPTSGGRVPLWVAATETLYLIEPDVFALIATDPPRLLSASRENDPWSAALREGNR